MLHPDERSAPTNVEGFIADADLVGGRYDVRGCSARDGLAALQCYDDADEPAAPVVYGAVFRSTGGIALQYWLFHAFDLWSPLVPQSPDYWKAHEGDWEAVTVLLDATGPPDGGRREPTLRRRAAGMGEGRAARIAAGRLLGARLARALLPPRPLSRRRSAAGRRRRSRSSTRTRSRSSTTPPPARAVSPRVVPVTATSPAWMRFPGTFGESQYLHFPQATFASGAGPRGPAFHELWRRPFAAPRTWPRG